MCNRKKVIAGAAAIAMFAFASMVALQARALGRKASGVRAGMSFAAVSRQLDGWAMINAHPLGRGTQGRPKPGPEYFGYSGEVYVLTPVAPDGGETDRRKISREEFEQRLGKLLSDGEPWTVYFNFRMVGRDTGVLVRFDESGKVASSQQPHGTAEALQQSSRGAAPTCPKSLGSQTPGMHRRNATTSDFVIAGAAFWGLAGMDNRPTLTND